MKQQLIIWQTVVLAALFLPTMDTIDLLSPGVTTDRERIFYVNPLLLNNKPFNFATFSMASRGTLAVVTGNPETEVVEKIPFRIYLVRDGKIVNGGASDTNRSMLEIDVAPVLARAKIGDNLIIEPVRPSDSKARRSIRLKPFFNYDLFSIFKKGGDRC